jgi:hypothetical protein
MSMSTFLQPPDTPVTTSKVCALGKVHVPKPLYCELHHIIPRAWQHFWTPPDVPLKRTAWGPLWAPETVTLCRTHHGNVHTWIAALMKAGKTDDPHETATLVKGWRSTREQKMALEALARFAILGGSLNALRKVRLFGAI